jgi:hypothetical protein
MPNNIPEVNRQLSEFVDGVRVGVDEMLGQNVDSIKSQMEQEGKPITYPVQWDSERQRRAFFATNGFGKGIPYQRTGRYIASWQHNRIPFGHQLFNAHPAGAVGGMPAGWQSRIHRNRWTYLTKVIFDELAKIPARISNIIKVVAGK